MYKCVTTSLTVALAILFSPALAWGQEDADAPISTAPSEAIFVPSVEQSEEPELLSPSVTPDLRRPWLSTESKERSCETARTLGVERGRQFHGVDMAPGKLVSGSTFGGGCDYLGGHLTAELGATMLVTESGKFGSRGLAEDLRLKIAYTTEIETQFCTVDLTGFATYQALDAGRGFKKHDDDYTTLGVGIGCTRWIRNISVRLGIEDEKLNPVNYVNSRNLWGPSVDIDTPFVFGGRFRLSGANTRSENSTDAGVHKQTWFAKGAARWSLGYGLVFAVSVRYDQYAKQDAPFGRCVARDARIFLCPLARGEKPAKFPQWNPGFQLTRYKMF